MLLGGSSEPLLATYLTCLLTALIIGYDEAVLNNPSEVIQRRLNISSFVDSDELRLTSIWSVSVSGWCLGGLVATFFAVRVVYRARWGCKKALYCSLGFCYLAAGLQFLVRYIDFPWILPIGRVVGGFGDGLALFASLSYIEDVAPHAHRLMLAGLFMQGINIGVLLSECAGLSFILAGYDRFEILFLLPPVLSTIQAVILWRRILDNPSYLISRGMEERAKFILTELWDSPDAAGTLEPVAPALDERRAHVTHLVTENRPGFVHGGKTARKTVRRITLLLFIQKLCGIHAFFFYSTDILSSARLSDLAAQLVTVSCAAALVAGTSATIVLRHKFPSLRHLSYVVGMGGMAVSTVGLAVFLEVPQEDYVTYLVPVSLYGFVLFYSVGPSFVAGELKQRRLRRIHADQRILADNKAEWLSLLLIAFIFPFIEEDFAGYSYVIFLIAQLIFMIWAYKSNLHVHPTADDLDLDSTIRDEDSRYTVPGIPNFVTAKDSSPQ